MTDTLSARSADPGLPGFPLRALRILLFTGFATVATVLGFVFLAPAGFLLALIAAWKGFDGLYWTDESPVLRAVSMALFAGFATVATIMGFVFLAPAGLILALVFLWKGFGGFGFGRPQGEVGPDAGQRPTGNAAFDAYRADTLRRLDEERDSFEGFLDRLRAAKDKSEFDRFMDDRVRRGPAARRTVPDAPTDPTDPLRIAEPV